MDRGGQGEVQGQRLQVTGAEPTYRPCEEWVGKLICNRPAMDWGSRDATQGQRLQVTGAEPTQRPCEGWQA